MSEGVKTLVATLVAVVAIAVGIALYVGHEHTQLHCVSESAAAALAPTRATGRPGTTLPPSRDNDAGRSRVPDSTPDADDDAVRSRLICR